MIRYAVALGSNLGNRLGHLQAAVGGLASIGEVSAISGLYESDPVGGPDQDPYLNAVVILDTEMSAAELLGALQELEGAAGRKRTVKWGPRTLDLDILTSDGPAVRTSELVIPHKASAQRRFVLEPLAEVWPDATVAGGVPASTALSEVREQGVDLLARRWSTPGANRVGRVWVLSQFAWFLAIAAAMAYDGSLPESEPNPSRLLGGLAIVVGGLLAYTSMRRLGSSLTSVPEPVEQGFLVESGSYARARHPIYGGVTLLLIGTAMVLDSVSGIVLGFGLFGFFWLKSNYEERQLRIAYPGYSAYRRRVPRRFIPFVI